jgi:hypothetical protein
MRRLTAVVLLLCAVAVSCTGDRVRLTRGPLGPASYQVAVAATGQGTKTSEHRSATLTVSSEGSGASFTLQTPSREVIEAQLERSADGALVLADVRGTSIADPGQTELASLVGQLDPPLPLRRVRIGDRWSSTRRISTDVLTATLRTNLRIVRYRRIAETDAAELEGAVRGQLQTTGPAGLLKGSISGTTLIDWAVGPGRVAAADTRLVWTLSTGDRVVLTTQVRPL